MQPTGSTVTGVRKPLAVGAVAIALVAVLVAAVVLGSRASSSGDDGASGAECTVPLAGTTSGTAAGGVVPVPVDLSAVQLQHASTINAVGLARGLPARARVIALATAYQESQLRNLPDGDRDSVGLFQQRPSQGWGTAAQISDPVYAAGKFYDALVEVADWQKMSLTKAAQAVQYSGFPDAYAKWEGRAATLAAALGGGAAVALTCRAGAQPPTADAPVRRALAGTSGAPATLAAVLSAAAAELGGVSVASITGTTAVVTVKVAGLPAAQAARALAAWAVDHSAGFGVNTVLVGSQQWSDHAWSSSPAAVPAGRVSITTT